MEIGKKRKLENWILGKMIFAENGNLRKFKMENIEKENGKLGEREIRQMGNHEEGIQGKLILGKREIGKKSNL